MGGTYAVASMLHRNLFADLSRWCIARFQWLLESPNHLLRLLGGLLFIAFVFKGVYNRYLNPLRRFPGPFWGSVTDLYKLYILYSSDLTSSFLALHKTYGEHLSSCRIKDVAGSVLTCS